MCSNFVRCASGEDQFKKARLGIVGLGHVGLPLAVEFSQAGFEATGVDLSDVKTCRVMAGKSYIADVPMATVADLVNKGKLHATTDFSVISDLDTVNMCVPTPLRKTKDPAMSFIVSACEEIAKFLHPGC